ncbi:putative membrane protein [Epilithonimonas bovis DSM 19482]|uniref:Putative membrane protein n=1 Tax=Epilithonimonas bovis DSM 19482 TaxID=1121284 RepID=A0A1U7PVG5_9FLAO|nr:phage holin family protein [Epilithonimonas bovis]QIY82832.1 phage holin family protein [Chryseobacterium sp. NEB161]SIT96494.1 putative membrane protein [Epilithonimonas bovis DSM 19482]HBR11740.1 phage holin family protein [Chryseobacterium sp.]
MNFIIRLLITAISAFLLSKILTGVHFDSFGSTIIFAILLGILNVFVRPILSILSLPITIVTLGLFSFVINALIILLTDYFMDSMYVDGFWWALLFSILLSLVTSLFSTFFETND